MIVHTESSTYKRAVYRHHNASTYPQLDFADALAVASMRRKGIAEIYSFDRDFDRVQDIGKSGG